jgi:putative nucleotidyltransferase with HDIG domain
MNARAVNDTEALRLSFAREGSRLAAAEVRAEIVVGGGFLVAALALPLLFGTHLGVSAGVVAMYVLAFALAARVQFDYGSSFTVPTQLVLVPMLFALPAQYVPLLAALALALSATTDAVRGSIRPGRIVLSLGNSWFTVGPAMVLAAAHADGPGTSVLVLFAALAAQFLTDFCGNVVRETLRHGASIQEIAAEMAPVYLIDTVLSPVGLAVAFAAEHRPWAIFLVLPLCGLLTVFSRERRARLEQLIELNDAYRGTALVLGDVVESDDAYTGEHCRGVVRLALDVADELGLDPQRRRYVEFGALLHDVGKLAVPKEIINKPGELDEREWTIIKMHTIEGERLLARVGGTMREVGAIVRSSHERWDGNGYPDGLRGEEIPLEARIVSTCDAFNAMVTTRSYRRAMPLNAAVEELTRNAGSQFDPQVVEALLRVLGRG